jgi:hypothetical protein
MRVSTNAQCIYRGIFNDSLSTRRVGRREFGPSQSALTRDSDEFAPRAPGSTEYGVRLRWDARVPEWIVGGA